LEVYLEVLGELLGSNGHWKGEFGWRPEGSSLVGEKGVLGIREISPPV